MIITDYHAQLNFWCILFYLIQYFINYAWLINTSLKGNIINNCKRSVRDYFYSISPENSFKGILGGMVINWIHQNSSKGGWVNGVIKYGRISESSYLIICRAPRWNMNFHFFCTFYVPRREGRQLCENRWNKNANFSKKDLARWPQGRGRNRRIDVTIYRSRQTALFYFKIWNEAEQQWFVESYFPLSVTEIPPIFLIYFIWEKIISLLLFNLFPPVFEISVLELI